MNGFGFPERGRFDAENSSRAESSYRSGEVDRFEGRQFRTKFKGGANVLFGNTRVVFADFGRCAPNGEVSEKIGNQNARPFDHGFPMTYGWVYRYPVHIDRIHLRSDFGKGANAATRFMLEAATEAALGDDAARLRGLPFSRAR